MTLARRVLCVPQTRTYVIAASQEFPNRARICVPSLKEIESGWQPLSRLAASLARTAVVESTEPRSMVAVGVHQKPSERTIDVESGIPLRQPLYSDVSDYPYAPIYNTGHSQYNGAELNRASYAPSEWSSECSRGEEEEEKQQSDDVSTLCSSFSSNV